MEKTAKSASYCNRLTSDTENGKKKGPEVVKVRVQGTKQALKGWEKFLLRQNKYKVLSMSETLPNKGTKKYFRKYADLAEY